MFYSYICYPQVEGKKYGLHAASILDVADGATGSASNQRPSKALVDRLDEYVEDPALLGRFRC